MKKRLPLIMILIFVLLFCSCGKENKKADISLFSPFYFEGETIRAAFVNKESICFSDYIKCNLTFEIEGEDGALYEEGDEYLPNSGENRLTLRARNGEEYSIILTAMKIDSLVANILGKTVYAIGEPLHISDFEVYGLLEGGKVDLPESAVEIKYDFSAEGEATVEFSCGSLTAEVNVTVRGEYIPELDGNMRAPDGAIYEIDEKGAVLKSGKGTHGRIFVPRAVKTGGKEYPVYAIADYAFRGNENLTGISCL